MFLALELFLGFYSMIMTDSLIVKFLFFVVSAVIVAFMIMKFTSKLLPTDIDSLPSDSNFPEEYNENLPIN